MTKLSIVTHSEDETKRIGKNLAEFLISRGITKGVVFLEGGLGSGKTIFAKGFASGLGIKENISSPTFVFISEYAGDFFFYHLDLYRIKNPQELDELGFFEYANKIGFVIIEWAEKVEAYIDPAVRVYMRKIERDERGLIVEILLQGVNIDERTLY